MSKEKNTENPEFRDSENQKESKEKEVKTTETVKENSADSAPEDRKAKEKTKESKEDKIPVYLGPYVKAYPGEKAFHVTSDHQVFLEKNKSLAVFHQKSINSSEKVQTIKVK